MGVTGRSRRGGTNTSGGGDGSNVNVMAYLPQKPDADEMITNDWAFEITWLIEMITPGDDADDQDNNNRNNNNGGRSR
jgi:hypothetical protein